MALAGSLQFSPSLGICRNSERGKQFKNVTGRGNQHLQATALSSRASRQDSWSCHLSASVHRPLCRLPYGCSVVRCHSFLFFGQNVAVPTVKTTAVALTRSCSALQSSPLVTKLVLAVGVIIFALWGLGPLMRMSRNIFLHKTDSSWRKSTTNYVMTSYLQPILLWTGATLICRALDPITMPTEASHLVKQRLLTFVKSLSTVLAFAYCLSSVIQQAQKYFMETNDPMGFQFAAKAVYSAVWVAAVSLFMELLGFSTQKWLTAGGLGTVLLTLAGREIFTNFLSSAMIHATRPFVENEWIQTNIEGSQVSGTVEHVGWWSPTIIRGEDREAVHIPNHKFTVNVVRNLSQKTHWRIKTHLAISHLDVSKINNIVADMRKVLSKNPQVEQQKLHRRVFLDNIDPENQALRILISCFVKTSHFEEYLCVKEAILLDLLRVISHHRARLATPIRTIQKSYNNADLESMSFSETIFSRGGPVSKRPLLLIEPPYKINGEDKSKSQARTVSTIGEQDSGGTGQIKSNPKTDNKVKGTSTTELRTKETSKSSNKAEGRSRDENEAAASPELDPKADVTVPDMITSGSTVGNGLKKVDNLQAKGTMETTHGVDEQSVGSQSKQAQKSPGSGQLKSNPKTDNKVKGISTTELHTKETSKSSNEAEGRSRDENEAATSTELDPKADVTVPDMITSGSTIGNGLKKADNLQAKGTMETTHGVDEQSVGSQLKQAQKSPGSKPSKSAPAAFEENIVLGVALEGSKRTLPIEEEVHSPPTSLEAKELATHSNGNGNGNLAAEKDEKDK